MDMDNWYIISACSSLFMVITTLKSCLDIAGVTTVFSMFCYISLKFFMAVQTDIFFHGSLT